MSAGRNAGSNGWRERLGHTVAPPRFIGFIVLLPIVFLGYRAAFGAGSWTQAAVIAFDVASGLFLLSLVPLLRRNGAQVIRRAADAYDANRLLVLVITTLLTIVVMVAIAGELPAARQGEPASIVKLVGTLLLTWAFANSVYALHYAHAYYHDGRAGGDGSVDDAGKDAPSDADVGGDGEGQNDHGGLDFPGEEEPDYADFAYFSFTLGMTFQTSDVEITSPRIRAVALLHSFAAFVFNLGVLAFTVNVLAGS